MLRPCEKLSNSSRAFGKTQEARRSTTTWRIAIRDRFKNLQLAVDGDTWRFTFHVGAQGVTDLGRRYAVTFGADYR
jgi:hypothetical protein